MVKTIKKKKSPLGTQHRVQESLLPLLHILAAMKSQDRIVIMSHLDDYTRDKLYVVIGTVLNSKDISSTSKNRIQLAFKNNAHKKDLEYILSDKFKNNHAEKNKRLLRIAGNPISPLLCTCVEYCLHSLCK
jgi:hypothetical protein